MSFKKRSSACLLSVGAILCAVFFILPSCQGPAGPAGKEGTTKRDTLYISHDTIITHDSIIRYDTTIYVDSIITHLDTVRFDTTIYDTTVFKDTSINIDTLLMKSNCVVCHSSSQEMASKQHQWAESKHATGASFIEEQGRRDCSRCHSGAAFRAFMDSGSLAKIDSVKYLANGGTNVNCRTCHRIHTKYDTTDWKLTGPDSVQLIVAPTVYAKVGKGNLCASCHQSRTDATTASAGLATAALPDDTVKLTSSRVGPHHGPQLNMILGRGGYEDVRYVTKPAVGTFGLHATLVKDGCVTCHLGTKQTHTFEPEVATCNAVGCHGNNALVPAVLSSVSASTQQLTIDSLLNICKDTLIAHKIAKKDTTATAATSITGILIQGWVKNPVTGLADTTKYPKKDLGLLFNYVTVCEDKSRGVHNFKYTKFILESALEGARH